MGDNESDKEETKKTKRQRDKESQNGMNWNGTIHKVQLSEESLVITVYLCANKIRHRYDLITSIASAKRSKIISKI